MPWDRPSLESTKGAAATSLSVSVDDKDCTPLASCDQVVPVRKRTSTKDEVKVGGDGDSNGHKVSVSVVASKKPSTKAERRALQVCIMYNMVKGHHCLIRRLKGKRRWRDRLLRARLGRQLEKKNLPRKLNLAVLGHQ